MNQQETEYMQESSENMGEEMEMKKSEVTTPYLFYTGHANIQRLRAAVYGFLAVAVENGVPSDDPVFENSLADFELGLAQMEKLFEALMNPVSISPVEQDTSIM